jgi:tRNA-dihydrouridine synthase
LIKRLKPYFSKPIIGNGDIQCYEDAQKMFDETGCERVMVGRAMMAKPWLIRFEPEPDVYAQGEMYGQFLKKVLEGFQEYYTEKDGRRRMIFLINQGKPWVEFGEFLQGRIQASNNFEEMKVALDLFFDQKQKIVKRTQLRQ